MAKENGKKWQKVAKNLPLFSFYRTPIFWTLTKNPSSQSCVYPWKIVNYQWEGKCKFYFLIWKIMWRIKKCPGCNRAFKTESEKMRKQFYYLLAFWTLMIVFLGSLLIMQEQMNTSENRSFSTTTNMNTTTYPYWSLNSL